jgi:CobQ-like glutamine amidotransferase family enzyme
LSGFENHGGHTTRGPGVTALATVRSGTGNGDGTEGAVVDHLVGTYMHGPVLARNPALADTLLFWATGHVQTPLDDGVADALRARVMPATSSRRTRVTLGRRASATT